MLYSGCIGLLWHKLFCAAQVISEDHGLTLDKVNIEMLGTGKKV